MNTAQKYEKIEKSNSHIIESAVCRRSLKHQNKFEDVIFWRTKKKHYFCTRRDGRVVDCGGLENR